MSNILGENHLPYVQDQIRTRQEILGKPIRDPKDQVWANGKNSWIRLISSVDISDQQIYQLQQTGSNQIDQALVLTSDSGSEFRNEYLGITGYSGNQLSSELVLQGGTLNPGFGDDLLKSSVSNTNNYLPSSDFNYGFGGTDFGLTPMPGIIGFNSKTYNNGSLRKAEIKILAHNKKQFEYIESIYLRLGYTMLLEWGNNVFPKDVDTYSTTSDISSLTLKGPFLNGSGDNQYYYTRIEELREESKGNYDAFLALVENFSWEFTTDRTYEITLNLISIGSVVESLKIALPSNTVTNPGSKDDVNEQYENALITTIEILGSPTPLNPDSNDTVEVPWISENFTLWGLLTSTVSNINFNPVRRSNEKDPKAIGCCAIFGDTKLVKYIRFKTLLDTINDNLLIYTTKGDPLIKVDTSEDLYGFSNSYSISSDPSKMIVKFDKEILGTQVKIFSGKTTIGEQEVDLNIEPFHSQVNGAEVCNIMNLYFSTDYLVEEVKNNIDKDNNLSLYKFVNNLLQTANNLLGNVNKFKLRLADKEVGRDSVDLPIINQVLEIYDEVQPYGKEKLLSNKDQNAIFKIGLGPSSELGAQSGFVTDYTLRTEISKNLSTMIAIGAQAGGEGVGEDATIFSKWNLGLVDRITPKRLSIDELREQESKEKEKAAGPLERLKKLTDLYSSTLSLFVLSSSSSSVTFENVEVERENALKTRESNKQDQIYTGYGLPFVYIKNFTKFIEIQSNWFKRALAFDAITKRSVTPTIGFLPINLSLTFDGLSGIRIFDKLSVDTSYLPTNYGNTLEFIITELDHYIENNKWYTRIGTQSIPNTVNFKKEQQARIDLQKVFVETAQFEEQPDVIVGDTAYSNSSLAKALDRSYYNPRRLDNQRNLPGQYKLTYVGSKNAGQKFSAGAVSPFVSIGTLGSSWSFGPVRDNVKLSSQNSSKSVYEQQYDGHYYLARPAAEALSKLISDAKQDGIEFTISSAYRNAVHNKAVGGASNSAHKYGGAIDIAELYWAVGGKQTPEANATVRSNNRLYKWLDINGPTYGWYNPQRLKGNSGQQEVWHWEFWGIEGQRYSLNAYEEGEKSGTPGFSFINEIP